MTPKPMTTERATHNRGAHASSVPSSASRGRFLRQRDEDGPGGWNPPPRVLLSLAYLAAAALIGPAHAAPDSAAIPDHPDKLTFPPLRYEPPSPAESRVTLANGTVAYLMPDTSLPLVNIVVLCRAGSFLDPAGKEGLATLTGELLARGGTATMKAGELEQRLDFLAAKLDSTFDQTGGRVSLNLLSKDLDEGMAILRAVLATPRFQDDKVALAKQRLTQEMARRNDDPADIERLETGFLAHGPEFFANRLPTGPSVAAITRDDLLAFHARWLHPAGWVIAASGDFDRDAMAARLGRLVADWPHPGQAVPPPPAESRFSPAGVYLYHKDISQGRVSVLLPGILRDDPDYFPILVMNDILGGGGFTSRITHRVRTEEGLAYDAGSRFDGGAFYPPPFRAFLQTKSASVAHATAIVFEEMKRIAAEPVSDAELATTLQGIIDRFPAVFGGKARVAERFAHDEITGRYAKDPDFWQAYRKRVAAVTHDDVRRVAARHLDPTAAAVLIVGDEPAMLAGDPARPARLQSLSPGGYHRLPPRDPLTLKRSAPPRPAP